MSNLLFLNVFLEIGIPQEFIYKNIFGDEDNDLHGSFSVEEDDVMNNFFVADKYLYAISYIAVRINDVYTTNTNSNDRQPKLASIDPIAEDIFGLMKTEIKNSDGWLDRFYCFSKLKEDITISYNTTSTEILERINQRRFYYKKIYLDLFRHFENSLGGAIYLKKIPVTRGNFYNTIPFYPIGLKDKELSGILYSDYKKKYWKGYMDVISYRLETDSFAGMRLTQLQEESAYFSRLPPEEIALSGDSGLIYKFLELLEERYPLRDDMCELN